MKKKDIVELLPSYFKGTLDFKEKERVEKWKEASEENRQLLADSFHVWEGIDQLSRMRKYNPKKAIQYLNKRITLQKRTTIFEIFQKVAAVIVLPLIIATIYFVIDNNSVPEKYTAWHTLETPPGIHSEFILPDSTKVHLNSNTIFSYPIAFNDNIREVQLSGEAYFEVSENNKVPFVVNAGKINIEVTGTEFQATNYPSENLTEIVLVKGSIKLFQGDFRGTKRDIYKLHPREMALWEADDPEMIIESVNIKKYIAWKNGILMFRDDPMPEVVRKLNRWFNVNIQLIGPEIKDYAYTATFESESLLQILDLLKISAPIEYTIKQRERKSDNTFSKMEIIIKQK
jgi:transmembrane sensor